MTKTPIKKNSITKNEIKYSLILNCMLFQLDRRHKNISNVVKITKKSEIPSMPTIKLMFREGNHIKVFTNWKSPVDLSKNNHNKIDITKFSPDAVKAIILETLLLLVKFNNNNKTPNKGIKSK